MSIPYELRRTVFPTCSKCRQKKLKEFHVKDRRTGKEIIRTVCQFCGFHYDTIGEYEPGMFRK